MIEANRAYVAMTHALSGYGQPTIDATGGWYALLYHVVTPDFAFLPDPDFEREAAYLYERAQRGEPLGGDLTPASR